MNRNIFYVQTNDYYWIKLLVFNSNNWNHSTVLKLAIIVRKKISFNSFKNEITNKLFTYKSYMYIHLNACKQMFEGSLLRL